MNKFWIVLSHSYLSRLKTKSFIITTILSLLLIVGLANFQSFIDLFSSEEEKDLIAVIDDTSDVYSALVEMNTSDDGAIELEQFPGTVEEAETAVLEDTYQGLLHIVPSESTLIEATYHSNQSSFSMIESQLQSQLQQVKVVIATNQAGLDQTVIEEIYAPLSFETVMIEDPDNGGQSAKTEEELSGARGLVYVMLFLLYFAVIFYGNMIAMDVANEETSRVMEILISSSSPVSQMFAKILGIGLLGLTQVGLFVVVGYIAIMQNQDEMVGGFFEYFGLQDIQVSTFIYALVFFLLGYLLYATLSAMLGSLVSRIEDVNQLMLPVTFLIMIAFFIAIFGLNMPDSTLVIVTSYIPFFTPMLMFLRVGMLDIAFWEIALSIILMLATTGILAIIGARIYRGGVLMYGTSTSLKDFKKALQLSKKE